MVENIKQTAYKVFISDILNSEFIHKEGWQLSYSEIDGKPVSKVNIIASVVSRKEGAIGIDDATGVIAVRLFTNKDKTNTLKIGDVVTVIGMIRTHQGYPYIVPEILKKLEDKTWLKYRREELMIDREIHPETEDNILKQHINNKNTKNKSEKTKTKEQTEKTDLKNLTETKTQTKKEYNNEEENEEGNILQEEDEVEMGTENQTQKIFRIIKKLDKGAGADIEDILLESGIENAEKYITTLINEGEIFEIRPGKVKVLE